MVEGYRLELEGVKTELEETAAAGGTESLVSAQFDRFRTKYKSLYLSWLSTRSGIISPMISGPSNFPAARMRKKGDVEYKKLCAIDEYKKRAVAAIKRMLRPDLAPVRSDDADAITRLKEKITQAEKNQETMKAINAFMRKEKDTEKRIVFLKEKGITKDFLDEFFIDGDGVPAFSLTNNSANIRRLKGRLLEVTRKQSTPASSEIINGIRLDICPAANRVRLFFPGKPAAETITALKRRAFRWTPSLKCWQAYLNNTALQAAKTFTEVKGNG